MLGLRALPHKHMFGRWVCARTRCSFVKSTTFDNKTASQFQGIVRVCMHATVRTCAHMNKKHARANAVMCKFHASLHLLPVRQHKARLGKVSAVAVRLHDSPHVCERMTACRYCDRTFMRPRTQLHVDNQLCTSRIVVSSSRFGNANSALVNGSSRGCGKTNDRTIAESSPANDARVKMGGYSKILSFGGPTHTFRNLPPGPGISGTSSNRLSSACLFAVTIEM